MDHTRPPTYELFRIGKSGGKFLVSQLRAVGTGEALHAEDLTAYTATAAIQTPWWKVTIGKGSRLLLSDHAAAPLIAEGIIEPIMSETLIPWRAALDARQLEKWQARKAGSAAVRQEETISRETTPGKAGMPTPAGGKKGVKPRHAASARKVK